MSPRVILFDAPDRFVAGTVGQPGDRTFFLQVQQGSRLVSVSLEKTQVQALAERLSFMIREIKQSDPTILIQRYPKDDRPLASPIEDEFRVGLIGLAFDAVSQLIQIDLQAVSESQGQQGELIDIEELGVDQDIVRIHISVGVADAFVKRAITVVSAGRTPCPFCGGPIDPKGHLCPRANGYRR